VGRCGRLRLRLAVAALSQKLAKATNVGASSPLPYNLVRVRPSDHGNAAPRPVLGILRRRTNAHGAIHPGTACACRLPNAMADSALPVMAHTYSLQLLARSIPPVLQRASSIHTMVLVSKSSTTTHNIPSGTCARRETQSLPSH
jgi:hypothetical protein